MKTYKHFLKKTTLFTVLDLSTPYRVNEEIINSLKESARKQNYDYIVYSPKKPHNVFENISYVVTSQDSESIHSSAFKHKIFEHQLIKPLMCPNISLEMLKESLVESIRDVDAISFLNEIRKDYGLEEVKIEFKPKENELRESYFAGKVFRLNETVSFGEETGIIIARGTNFVTVISEDGIISNKFLEDIHESNEQFLYDEFDGDGINYKTFKSQHIPQEIAKYLGEHFGSSLYTPKVITQIQKLDFFMENLEDLDNIYNIHKLINEIKTPEVISMVETLIDAEDTLINEEHVIYNNKDDTVHSSGYKTKEDAYHHLVDKLKFHPNYTILHKNEIESHKTHNAKVKKIFPNRYQNESKNYTIANDIIDYPEFQKMKKGILRNGMTKKSSSVISVPLVKKESVNKDEDALVEGINLGDILEEYNPDEFENVIIGLTLSEQYPINENLHLKEKTSQGDLNKKAIRIATTTLRKKLASVPLKDLDKGDREKLERIVASNTSLINTIAMKLSPKLKKVELEKLMKREKNA